MKSTRVAIVLALLLWLGCYRGGARLNNDLDSMERIATNIGGQAWLLWVARSPEDRARGLAYIEADRVASLEDGTTRGMISVLDPALQLEVDFENRLFAVELAAIDADGHISASWLPVTPAPAGVSPHFLIEAPRDRPRLSVLTEGARVRPLPARHTR